MFEKLRWTEEMLAGYMIHRAEGHALQTVAIESVGFKDISLDRIRLDGLDGKLAHKFPVAAKVAKAKGKKKCKKLDLVGDMLADLHELPKRQQVTSSVETQGAVF